MEMVLKNNFAIQYAKEKKCIYEELKARIDTVILDSIKQYLIQKGITPNSNSTNLAEFKDDILDIIDEETRVEIAKLEEKLNQDLNAMILELKDGSQTAVTKFTEKLGVLGKSAVEMVARTTAIRAAYVMNPTIGSVALGASILAPLAYKTVKDIRDKSAEEKKTALDVMIFRLCTKKDGDNTIIDIDQSIMDAVYEKLKGEGITINKENPSLFFSDITQLDNRRKESIVRTINNLKGNDLDIEEEMRNTKLKLKSIQEVIGKDLAIPVSTAALYGMAVGGILENATPNITNSTATLIGQERLNNVISSLVGKVANNFGEITENVKSSLITSVDSNSIATIVGPVVATIAAATTIPGIWKGVKGLYHKLKERQKREDAYDKENSNINEELNIAFSNVEEEIKSRSDKNVMLDIVKDILISKGIAIPQDVNSVEKLKGYLRNLDDADKKDVYNIATTLESIIENGDHDFKKIIQNVAKTAYWGGVLALAGVGMYDLMINPGFLEGIGRQVEAKNIINKMQEAKEIQEGVIATTNAGMPKVKSLKDLIENASTYKEAFLTIGEANKNINRYDKVIAAQTKVLSEIQSGPITNPYEVLGKGAAVGAGIAIGQEVEKKKPGFFSNIKEFVASKLEFITTKFRFGKKTPRLPAGTETIGTVGDPEKLSDKYKVEDTGVGQNQEKGTVQRKSDIEHTDGLTVDDDSLGL